MDSDKLLLARYIATVKPNLLSRVCAHFEIDMDTVVPFEFEKDSDVLDCIRVFDKFGIGLDTLFLCQSVWRVFLHAITEERYHKGIDLVLSTNDPKQLIYYIRACYRLGFPCMSDSDADGIEKLYIDVFPELKFFEEQTYDDDRYGELVKQAIRLSSVKNTGKSASAGIQRLNLETSGEYADLNTEKSTSIRPVTSAEEAFDFWKNSPNCRVHFSLKIDGVNTKMVYSKDADKGLELALSRGRSADSIDYTDAIRAMFRCKNIDDTMLSGRVTGESFVELSDLRTIQSRYPDKDYKTPKSTAMAMLRAPGNFLPEDFKYLSFYAFDYNSEKPDVAFRKLEKAGINVPPYLEFDGDQIPRTSVQDFDAWLHANVLDVLWEAGNKMGIGSDGVVMFLLADIDTERKDKYSDSNIAIKYSYWSAASYTSKVRNIVFEQRRVEASIVLEIEPTEMRDRNMATRVGVGSPDILIKDDVRIGDTIEFERKSEAYNVYLRKLG